MAKKRNPQDATTRNIRAAAKRDASLLDRVTKLEARVTQLEEATLGTANDRMEATRRSKG